MSKKLSIMSSVFLFSIAVTLIDAFIHPNYFVKEKILYRRSCRDGHALSCVGEKKGRKDSP